MDPNFLDLGTSWRWVVSFTPPPLYPWGKKAPDTHWICGWVEPVWTTWRRENSWPYRDSNSHPSVIQTVPCCYTNYGIPAPLFSGNQTHIMTASSKFCYLILTEIYNFHMKLSQLFTYAYSLQNILVSSVFQTITVFCCHNYNIQFKIFVMKVVFKVILICNKRNQRCRDSSVSSRQEMVDTLKMVYFIPFYNVG
jgi:hypothetical protein